MRHFAVMENFKNFPTNLYGLNPTQMDMFMTEDSPMKRQSEKVTEVCPSTKASCDVIHLPYGSFNLLVSLCADADRL